MSSEIQFRIHGSPALPTLVYLPGLHGDWTLAASFRRAVSGRVRFVEIAYPRTKAWSVADHAQSVESALLKEGVDDGWLLAESFSSLTAWKMIERTRREASPFRVRGLVLAGGFVRHPWPWGARLLRAATAHAPNSFNRFVLAVYRNYARFRHPHRSESREGLQEFVANRLHASDRAAMIHRFTLVIGDDARPVARGTQLPVYCLAGLVDPVVPYPLVRGWLKRHCPGFRGCALIWSADHNVLGTAPDQSATTILGWMEAEKQRDLQVASTQPANQHHVAQEAWQTSDIGAA